MIVRARWVGVRTPIVTYLSKGVTFIVLWTLLERRFVFFPVTELLYTPSDVNLEYEDVQVRTSDDLMIKGWFIPGWGSDVTWLWFHGNGGNLGHRVGELEMAHHRIGANIFIFDYRGYGESEGVPSEKGTYLDSRAAIEYLSSRPGVNSGRIVYIGHSLGAAVAIEAALTSPPMAMILISPFASVRDMASLTLPFPPAGWLLRNHYDNISRVRKLTMPLLVLHGDQDETVPIYQGRKLYEAANEPKKFHTLEGAAHNDTYQVGGEQYWRAIESFLSDVEAEDGYRGLHS